MVVEMVKYIINVHSMVDIITNSSTEIFVLDTEKGLQMVKDMVMEMERKYPNEYGHRINVDLADDWELRDIFGYHWDKDEQENMIKFLISKGYTITPPENEIEQSRYISISFERGGLHPKLDEFIRETFNVVSHNSDG